MSMSRQIVTALLLLLGFGAAVTTAAVNKSQVVRIGTMHPISTSIDIIRLQWGSAWSGLYAAFAEANRTNALGTDKVWLLLEDIVPDWTPGLNAAAAQTLVNKNRVTALAHVTYYGIFDAFFTAIPQGVPIVGGLSPESVLLFSNPAAINFRVAFLAEVLHMLHFAMNSDMHCRRFGFMWYDDPSVKLILDEFIDQFIGEVGWSVEDYITVALPQTPPSWQPYVDKLMPFRPHCVFYFSGPDLLIPSVMLAMQHPLYNPDIRWFGSSAANLPAYPPLPNVYLVQQFPDPNDVSYDIVKKYQAAMKAVFASGFDRPLDSAKGPWVSDKFNYNAFEGYVIGRMTVEILKRVPDYSAASFVQSVYANKMYQIDDLILGPFSTACTGREADASLPCFCTSASKFVYVSQVSPVDGVPRGAQDNAALGEKGVAVSRVPFTQCTLSGSNIHQPYLFVQLLDASRTDATSTRRAAFNAGLREGFNALRGLQAAGSLVALTTSSFMGATVDYPALLINQTFRYRPLAVIGSPGIPGAAFDAPPNGTGPAYIGSYLTVMPLADPPASNFRRGNVDFFPVLADFVHTLAASIAASYTEGTRVTAVATSPSELALAVQSLNTFQIDPVARGLSAAADAASVMLSADAGTIVLVVTQDAAVLTAVLSAAGSATATCAGLYVASSEEALAEALASSASVGLGVANAVTPIYFASDLSSFWHWNTTATATSSTSVVELFNALMAPRAAPHPAAFKAFRLALLLKESAAGLRPIRAATFIDALYSRTTTTALDATMGPMYPAKCVASGADASSPARQCQCAKGPHRFFVQRLRDWAATLYTNRAVASPPVFTYAMLTCGVQYVPLYRTTSNVALIVGLCVGLGAAVAILVGAQVGFLAVSKRRDNSAAPKDAARPFAIAFTDIQSSTSLWARAPTHMAKAVDTHHDLLRQCVKKYGGYEVKTIGDSFMVAFQEPKAAIEFAVAVQTTLVEHDWKTEELDRTYVDLTHEANVENEAANKPLLDAQSYLDRALWRGLRVRVGVHYGSGSIKLDEVTLGYDYYGTVVNTAARIEGVGNGGQVLVSEAAYNAITANASRPLSTALPIQVTDLGPQPLRGLDEPIRLYQLQAKPLERRKYGPLRLDIDVVEDIQEEVEAVSTDTGSRSSGARSNFFAPDTVGAVVLPLAWRYAERANRARPHEAHESVMSNFVFLKALLSTSGEAASRATIDALLLKWRIRPQRPTGNASKSAALDFQMMQVAVKATPAADALKKDFGPAIRAEGLLLGKMGHNADDRGSSAATPRDGAMTPAQH